MTGRYISSDPIGLAGGLNTFGYAGQSPGNYIDPKGLFWESLSPAAYHEAGQFTDFLLNHSDEINNVFWDFFAQDFIDSANDFHGGHYAGAVFSAICGIAKPLKVVKGADPDFIVSPEGTVISTNKDYNLVDTKQKNGDWFQIHNTHNHGDLDKTHTHFPVQHGQRRVHRDRQTSGSDMDFADRKLRERTMRERTGRKDKGGPL